MKRNQGEITGGPALVLNKLSEAMQMYYQDASTFAVLEVDAMTIREWAEELNRMAWWLHEQDAADPPLTKNQFRIRSICQEGQP